jgi:chromosome segregation ATPase
MLVGRVDFGEFSQARSASYSAVEDAMARSIVRLECEVEELRAEVAMLKQGMVILAQERNEAREDVKRATYDAAQETIKVGTVKSHWIEACRERDEARVQFRSVEALAMALVKTIDELKTEKAELTVKLVNLQAGSRPATLEEIRESVRDKHDPEYEFGGRDDE